MATTHFRLVLVAVVALSSIIHVIAAEARSLQFAATYA